MSLIQFLAQDKNLVFALTILGATVPWLGKAIYDSAYPGTFHASRGVISGILPDQTPCGSTPDEAIAKGCRFESYTATWQLPQCYDKDLDDEFRVLRPWKFYLDINGTTEVTLAELESGVDQAWTTWEFHLWQCAFYWKKEVKIAHGLTSGSISTHQCLDNSLMQESKHPKDYIGIPYWPRFTSCRPPSDISVHQFEPLSEEELGKEEHSHGYNSENIQDVHHT
ncbi:hypothetical protein LX36DRAFT_737452 [Colletotrichum falcatum]|nr:hypothetical protein LX36DRAFT_737452 [Colletotrichum falcatum]